MEVALLCCKGLHFRVENVVRNLGIRMTFKTCGEVSLTYYTILRIDIFIVAPVLIVHPLYP